MASITTMPLQVDESKQQQQQQQTANGRQVYSTVSIHHTHKQTAEQGKVTTPVTLNLCKAENHSTNFVRSEQVKTISLTSQGDEILS